jgi:hypothetical protein
MYQKIVEESVKKALFSVVDDVIGFWKIYYYLKYKLSKQIDDNQIEINSAEEFWYAILKDKFRPSKNIQYKHLCNYQKVKIKSCFISDWIPKLPGKIWTLESLSEITEASKYFNTYRWNNDLFTALIPESKMRQMAAGYGSVRLSPNIYNNPDNFYCLSANFPSCWNVDYGIPLVISKLVYDEYLKHNENGAPEATIEGILVKDYDLPLKEIITSAIGATIDKNLESILTKSPGLPKCFVYISSPLLCNFKDNDSHPECTAWTCFETRKSSYDFEYLYTYSHFNPTEKGSIDEAISFIQNYVQEYNGKKIITDFDGMIPRLDALVKLDKDPLISSKGNAKKIIQSCSNDYKKTKIRET